jgi:hypothetical protein
MIAPHIAAWALNKRKSNTDVAAVVATPVYNINDKVKKPKHTDAQVLETKGGGGYVPPPQPTPQEQAQARDWEAAQEFEREQKRQDAIDAKAAIDKQASDAAWLSGKNSAYQGAQSGARSRLNSLGITAGDPYGLYSSIMGKYDTANNALQQGADYSGAFSPNVYEEEIGSARTGQRNKYATQFGSAINPYYAEDTFGNTRDDTILASILDTQYGDALADLQSARDRGQATSSVYDRALRDLDTGRATANTELQGIGRGVLEDVRGDINTRRQGSLDSAAAWDFGGTYDPTAEANRIRNYAEERGAQLEGDVRGAVGGKQFFDINSLLGKAKARVGSATAPGATDTGSSALLDTFANEASRNNQNIKQNEGIF